MGAGPLGADGVVAGVRQELELRVLCRERQQDCFADGPLRVLEGLLEIRVPRQFPLLSFEGVVKWGEDVGNPWQESVIICYHADKFLQGLDGLGRRESGDCFDFVLRWSNAVAGQGMAEELHLSLGQGTLLGV